MANYYTKTDDIPTATVVTSPVIVQQPYNPTSYFQTQTQYQTQASNQNQIPLAPVYTYGSGPNGGSSYNAYSSPIGGGSNYGYGNGYGQAQMVKPQYGGYGGSPMTQNYGYNSGGTTRYCGPITIMVGFILFVLIGPLALLIGLCPMDVAENRGVNNNNYE